MYMRPCTSGPVRFRYDGALFESPPGVDPLTGMRIALSAFALMVLCESTFSQETPPTPPAPPADGGGAAAPAAPGTPTDPPADPADPTAPGAPGTDAPTPAVKAGRQRFELIDWVRVYTSADANAQPLMKIGTNVMVEVESDANRIVVKVVPEPGFAAKAAC